MKFTLSEIRKTLLGQVNILPGDKIRPECSTFDCSLYSSMLVLNNNSDLEKKVICPKILCKRVQKGNFLCQLTNKRYSVTNGAHIDLEFYSYASLFNKEPEEDAPVKKQSIKKKAKAIPEEMLVSEDKTPIDFIEDGKEFDTSIEKSEDIDDIYEEKSDDDQLLDSTDDYISRICADMNNILGIKTFKDFIHKGVSYLMFTNPFTTDLTQTSIKINFTELRDYGDFLHKIKEYYADYIAIRKATSCTGCAHLKEKAFSTHSYDSPVYSYPQKGLSFIFNGMTEQTILIQKYVPTTKEVFNETVGKDFTTRQYGDVFPTPTTIVENPFGKPENQSIATQTNISLYIVSTFVFLVIFITCVLIFLKIKKRRRQIT